MPSQDYYYQGDWAQIADKVEPEMRRKILLAAEEQGIKVEFVTELEAA
jgi:ribosomal protein L32E